MLKRFALLVTATAALTLPSTAAFAVPETAVDGVLPETLCHANIPSHLQPVTCGRGAGGPDGQY